MAGTDPHRQLNRLGDFFPEHLGQPLSALGLNALHAENKGFSRKRIGLQLRGQRAQLLGTDGDDHHFRKVQGPSQIRFQPEFIRQNHVFIFAFRLQGHHTAGARPAPQHNVIAGAVVSGQESTPAAAAQYSQIHIRLFLSDWSWFSLPCPAGLSPAQVPGWMSNPAYCPERVLPSDPA